MGRLLCWLFDHDWEKFFVIESRPGFFSKSLSPDARCKRCGITRAERCGAKDGGR